MTTPENADGDMRPDAAPTPSPKRRLSRRLVAIAAAAALLLALIVVVALVLPRVLGAGSAANLPDVVDIPREPRATWSFDWVGGADAEFIDDSPVIAGVGTDRALVWASFDSYAFAKSQGDSVAWYEGYDEHYAAGYQAGLDYGIDYQNWLDDTTFAKPLPRDEDYYPDGAYGNFDEWLGFDDGFWDAKLGKAEGFSKKQQPVAPDYAPTITLLDISSGTPDWTVDLSQVIDGVDYSSSFYAIDIPGSEVIAVSASHTEDDTTSYSVVTLSKTDGSLVSELSSDGAVGILAFEGDLIVSASQADDDTSVSRFTVADLVADPVWQTVGPQSSSGATVSRLGTGYLEVLGDEEGVVLVGATGAKAEFGEDVDVSIDYSYAGEHLVRIDRSSDATRIDGWTTSGDSAWRETVVADYARVVDGVLLTATADGDAYARLMALDPSSGTALWPAAAKGDFDSVYGVRDGSLLVVSEGRLTVLDVGSGTARFTQKLGEIAGFHEGADSYYVATADALAAYDYGSKGALWRLDLADDEAVIAVGRTLGLVEGDAGILRGLSPR